MGIALSYEKEFNTVMLSSSFYGFLFAVTVGYGAALLLVFLVTRMLALAMQTIVHYKQARRSAAAYAPPMGLSPAEVGYLFDRKYGDNELLSSLACMAQRGLLKIDTSDPDWLISPVPGISAELDLVEEVIVYDLFESSDVPRRLSDLTARLNGRQALRQKFENAVLGQLSVRGLVDSAHTSAAEPLDQSTTVSVSLLMTVATIIFPTYFINLNSQNTIGNEVSQLDTMLLTLALMPIYLLVWYLIYLYTQLAAYTYYRAAGLPIGATQALRDSWHEIAQYREYLLTVEKSRHQASAKLDDPVVPYLIAVEAMV